MHSGATHPTDRFFWAKGLQSIEDTLHLRADFLVYSDKKVGRKEAPEAPLDPVGFLVHNPRKPSKEGPICWFYG